jgi:peptidoglycan/xylan/chitin deacetylase (PgdA/CDA1 family)
MKVALTFDDGPDPKATPELLDLLKREGIQATFFCIGKNVEANPDIAKRIAGEGHLLANHSYTHPWYISMLMGPSLRREMERTQEAIKTAAGVTPKYFRPPSGTTGPNFPGALKRVGLTLVGWDVRSLDTVATPEKAVERIVRLAGDGSIILLHDGRTTPARIVEIVEAAVRELKLRGFGFERLDRLIEESGSPHPSCGN